MIVQCLLVKSLLNPTILGNVYLVFNLLLQDIFIDSSSRPQKKQIIWVPLVLFHVRLQYTKNPVYTYIYFCPLQNQDMAHEIVLVLLAFSIINYDILLDCLQDLGGVLFTFSFSQCWQMRSPYQKPQFEECLTRQSTKFCCQSLVPVLGHCLYLNGEDQA